MMISKSRTSRMLGANHVPSRRRNVAERYLARTTSLAGSLIQNASLVALLLATEGCKCGSDPKPSNGGTGGGAGAETGGSGGATGGGAGQSTGGGGSANMGGTGGNGGDCTTLDCGGECETETAVRSAAVGCICETKEGCFVGLESKTAVKCDADGDGWVNDNAQASIEGSDPVLKENARCTLRKVNGITLVNERSEEHTVELTEAFPGGLPLYETARNDSAPAATQPAMYGGASLDYRMLNSLTKACVGRTEDYNDNGIDDVSESVGEDLGQHVLRNASLESYYAEYLRFSYFLELYNGYADAEGSYRIEERSRSDRSGEGVPLVYPAGTDPFWQQCFRHVDTDYGPGARSFAGGDFTQFTSGWSGMTHHSQFKCVQVVSEASYEMGSDRATSPQVVFKHSDSTGLARKVDEETPGTFNGCEDSRIATGLEVYDWYANSCQLDSEFELADAQAPNPSFPAILCDTVPLADVEEGVMLVAVGYSGGACTRDDSITVTDGDYTRGCINECAELGVMACENFDPDTPEDSGRYTCDDESRVTFGRLECGCGRNYGGANCDIGCPSDSSNPGALTSEDFSIETRQGYWMCGRVVASSGELSGGPYTLRGYIPIAPVDGTVLESSDGRYRLEAR